MLDLQHRDRQPELMDQAGLDPQLHAQALAGLKRVNQFSQTPAVIFRELSALSARLSSRPLKVLDLASGGGDVAVQIGKRAQRRKLPLQIDGCDVSPTAVSLAQAHARNAGLTNVDFFVCNVLSEPLPTGYDIVMCSLFLHHLDESDTISILQKMSAACTHMVLVDDLLRTAWGYLLAWAGCRLLTRSRIVHVDGPLSVRGAFSEQEFRQLALQAGLERAEFRRHWPQRLTLRWIKPQATTQ